MTDTGVNGVRKTVLVDELADGQMVTDFLQSHDGIDIVGVFTRAEDVSWPSGAVNFVELVPTDYLNKITTNRNQLGQAQKQTLHCSGLPRFDGVVPFGMERIAGYVEASHIGI